MGMNPMALLERRFKAITRQKSNLADRISKMKVKLSSLESTEKVLLVKKKRLDRAYAIIDNVLKKPDTNAEKQRARRKSSEKSPGGD